MSTPPTIDHVHVHAPIVIGTKRYILDDDGFLILLLQNP
jgi:hypothetical protein